MDTIPTALDILNALLLETETNLEQAKKDFIDAHKIGILHKESSNNLVAFHMYARDLLDDLVKLATIGERVIMLEYFIKILNESKEMCQVK